MSGSTTLLPFQPSTMSSAQLAAVSYLARSSGHTDGLYAYQLRQWFGWFDSNRLDPWPGSSEPMSGSMSASSATAG